MLARFLLALFVVLALLKQELRGVGMENNGDYKVPMREHSKQSSRKDQNILQDMRRYSGVLSVFGDQQWFTMNAELSARGECGNTLAIYKKASEDGKCSYHITIDLNKVCGMLTPDTGKNEGLHLLMLFTTEKRCHMISALSAVERDNWAREISQMIGKGHSFPVVLPTKNLFGHKDALLYYNTIKKNLLLISKPNNSVVEKCSLLAMWNMSEVKSFGSSRSKLVIQTKNSCSLGTSHLSFQTPMARRIVHLMQNKCEEECSCCCKPHPFSQMASSGESSNGSSGSESDDEISVVKVEVRSRSLQRLHSVSHDMQMSPRNGRKTPEPSSGNKILKKAATIDRYSTRPSADVTDSKKDDTILNSFLFSPNRMNKFNSDGILLPRNGTIPRASRPSLPESENTYEEIKPRVQSKNSLYEEIPDDLRKRSTNPVYSSTPTTPNGYRNSWSGQQGKQLQSHESLQRTYSRTLHASYSEDARDTLVYEAMNRQEELATKQHIYPSPPQTEQQEEDSYVCMHSLTNRQSLSLKPVTSDGQLSMKQNSSIPMYINNSNDNLVTYANLTDVSDIRCTGNLAYAEISSTMPTGLKSRSCSASPDPTSYAQIDHQLTEALRVTSIQREPLCRAQTLDTTEHKKVQNKKWLAKLTSKKT